MAMIVRIHAQARQVSECSLRKFVLIRYFEIASEGTLEPKYFISDSVLPVVTAAT